MSAWDCPACCGDDEDCPCSQPVMPAVVMTPAQSALDPQVKTSARVPSPPPIACEWCGRAIRQDGDAWLAVKGVERGYDPLRCDASDDGSHSPSVTDGAT